MEARDLIGIDLSEAVWRKSSLSGGSGGNCIEIASNMAEVVAIRDSKNPNGPVITFPRPEWKAFLDSVKEGAFK